MKLDGTVMVTMRRDTWFAITQPRTEPIDDLNDMRMRPNIRSDDDVEYCIIQGTHRDKALNVRGAVKTPVKVPPTTHGVALHTGHH